MTLTVWSYSESVATANEVASAANVLANSVGGKASMIELDSVREGTSSAGGRLVLKASAAIGASAELAAEAIYRAVKQSGPSVILFGATRTGREIASRLAVKMRVGCMSDLTSLTISGEELWGHRSVFSGKFTAAMGCPLPCVATVSAGAFEPLPGNPSGTLEMNVGEIARGVQVIASTPKERGSADLRRAKVIVAAGRGVKKKEDLVQIDRLAAAMGGAVGCSRPLSSDLGWLPEECHIGLTGIYVRPQLYLAVGISGQLQHVAGIKDSKVIAAINSDKDAPIFQVSDYGIVGDLYAVVPALLKQFGSQG